MVRLAVALVAPASGTDQLLHALRLLASPTRIEPGCLACRVWTDDGNRSMVRYVEEWASQSALDEHFRSPHFAAAGARFGELLAAPPEVTVYDVAGSRKLDLTA